MQRLSRRLVRAGFGLLALGFLQACERQIESVDGSSSAGGSTSSSTGSSMGGPCSTDDGYRICGGPNDCDKMGPKDNPCGCFTAWPDHEDLGLCTADIQEFVGNIFTCPDGTVTVDPGLCIPWSLGMLL
ncbi:MAG TPA: hypothetical protein VL400_26135, partial [Polyangiaceae bacterium]|nr:hypothetical protein [Polyangiaceae bacterium]